MKVLKVLEYVKNILMILIILFVIIPIAFISSIILFKTPDEVPGFFGWNHFIVLNNSMNPTIESGDLVLVKEVNEKE